METALSAFDYDLPPELIAQEPCPSRQDSRLLVLPRGTGRLHHARFRDLPEWLAPEDVLVVNDTRVFPARLAGHKDSGGRIELLLTAPPAVSDNGAPARKACGRALWRASRPPRPGQILRFGPGLEAEVVALPAPGEVEVRFLSPGDVVAALQRAGDLPLPPYIRRPAAPRDRERYQTIFARETGAVAAPTAGLHFTPELVDALRDRGVDLITLTLHVGPGTFQPLRHEDYRRHRLAPEFFRLSPKAAARLDEARRQGRRIVAVGTTTVRVLESRVAAGRLQPGSGWCDLFIHPGHVFQVVDKLITNFHLPKSSLLLLVAAFAGWDQIAAAYREAVARQYRFYSYGDAMLIV